MVSIEKFGEEKVMSPHEVAQAFRENLSVYNFIQRDVMKDFEAKFSYSHEDASQRWVEEFSPRFETSFFHVVERMVEQGEISKDTKPEEILEKFEKNIVHDIEGELGIAA